jgi:biopolymer transport protein ExbD
MAKIKVPRKSTAVDMTPMVDVAFLLITFFMLTVKFRPEETVEVTIPSSIADTKLPEKDIAIVKISKDGRVLFGIDSKYDRVKMLENLANHYQLPLTEEQKAAFSLLAEIGLPYQQLGQYLLLSPQERKNLQLPGIPVDSTNNQLRDWVVAARLANPKLRFAIKGDKDAPYPVVRQVIETLREKKVTRFALVTSLESAENEKKTK